MLLPALLASLVLASPSLLEAHQERSIDALAVPLLSFNSDQGVGYGGVGGMYLYGPGYVPYQHALSAQVFFTRLGIQNHFLRYDGPGLLAGMRVEARLEYRSERLAPFLGPGNLSAPDYTGDLRDRRFAYQRRSPAAWVRVRQKPLGADSPLQTYVGAAWRTTWVGAYEGSVLQALRAPGIHGGATGQFLAGAMWDTRDDEADPSRGGLSEVGLRLAAPFTGSRYRFGGVTVASRRFWPLGGRLVLAQRATFDHQFGDVPFFEWANIGGMAGAEGVGGMSSVRGVPRNRYAGNTKAFLNTELRLNAFRFPLFGQPTVVGALAFLDLGRVWHPRMDSGPWYLWHPGVGAGVRVARRAAVFRFDYAVAPETLRQGVYFTFGHMF